MDGEEDLGHVATGRCPQCEVCGAVVRVRGLGRVGVWCAGFLGGFGVKGGGV